MVAIKQAGEGVCAISSSQCGLPTASADFGSTTRHWRKIAMASALLSPRKPLNPPTPDFPLFKLGQIVATPAAIDLLRSLALNPLIFLGRHAMGNWGQIDDDDREANRQALKYGNRLLSSYQLNKSEKLWIITEADRSATTLLLPQEY
jgi:hypothetical protein